MKKFRDIAERTLHPEWLVLNNFLTPPVKIFDKIMVKVFVIVGFIDFVWIPYTPQGLRPRPYKFRFHAYPSLTFEFAVVRLWRLLDSISQDIIIHFVVLHYVCNHLFVILKKSP